MSTATNKPSHATKASANQPSAGPAPGGNAASKATGVEKAKPAMKQRPKAATQRTTAAKPTNGSKARQTAKPEGASVASPSRKKGVTFKQAAERVIREADGPMKVKDIPSGRSRWSRPPARLRAQPFPLGW